MRITFVRHGESKRNKKRIIQKQVAGGLTRKGRNQAKRLAERLSGEFFDIIYCSDAERAKETAREIIRFHRKTPIKYTKKLREMNAGDYIGASWEEYGNAREESMDGFAKFKPIGGESIEEMVKRIGSLFNRLYKAHNEQHILLVTHGGANKALKHLIERGSSEPVRDEGYEQDNCCVNVMEYDGKNSKLILYNCTKHLR